MLPAAGSPPRGRPDKGAGAGRWVSRPAVRSSRGRGGAGRLAAAGRGRGGAARARLPGALPLSLRAPGPARTPSRECGGGATAGKRAVRVRHAHSPPRPPAGRLQRRKHCFVSWDPGGPRFARTAEPAARPARGSCSPPLRASAASAGGGRAPGGSLGGVKGRGCAPWITNRFFTEGRQGPKGCWRLLSISSFGFQCVRFKQELVIRFPARVSLTLAPP